MAAGFVAGLMKKTQKMFGSIKSNGAVETFTGSAKAANKRVSFGEITSGKGHREYNSIINRINPENTGLNKNQLKDLQKNLNEVKGTVEKSFTTGDAKKFNYDSLNKEQRRKYREELQTKQKAAIADAGKEAGSDLTFDTIADKQGYRFKDKMIKSTDENGKAIETKIRALQRSDKGMTMSDWFNGSMGGDQWSRGAAYARRSVTVAGGVGVGMAVLDDN